MSADKRNGAVSRRAFIHVAAGSAIVLPGLMAACSAPAPSAPAAQPTTGAGPASTISAFTNGFYPPTTPHDQNLAWQSVDKKELQDALTASGR